MHAASGCDTTSAPFGFGKLKCLKLLQRNAKICDTVEIFNCATASPTAIETAGEQFLLKLYGAEDDVVSLDEHRYYMYHRLIGQQGVKSQLQVGIATADFRCRMSALVPSVSPSPTVERCAIR